MARMRSQLLNFIHRTLRMRQPERIYASLSLNNPDMQTRMLHSLLRHAATHVPYYKNILPQRKEWFREFLDIPILTKQTIRTNTDSLRATPWKTRQTYKNTSGGATGAPVVVYQDDAFRDWCTASEMYFYRQLMGCDFAEESKVVIWGSEKDVFDGSIGLRATLMNWLRYTTYFNAFRMTSSQRLEYLNKLNQLKPSLIKAYAGSLYELARHAKSLQMPMHAPRFIHSAAETLRPFMRELIQDVFKCKVYDFYGSREVGPIAGECSHGKLHMLSFNNFVEVVDEQGKSVPPDQEGRVLVTTLHNYSMPLIRYEIGDTAVAGDTCTCGNSLPTLSRISGRITDSFLTADGSKIHGEYFTHLFYFREWLSEFQVIQTALDRIDIYFVATAAPLNSDIVDIEKKVRVVMGNECQVLWHSVSSVPRTPNGKLLYTRSLITLSSGKECV